LGDGWVGGWTFGVDGLAGRVERRVGMGKLKAREGNQKWI